MTTSTEFRSRVDGALGRTIHGVMNPEQASGAESYEAYEGSFRPEEERLLDSVETYLDRGRDLRRWWNTVFPDRFAERFELSRSYDRPDRSFGFFDQAPVDGRSMNVMGNYQRMFYDEPKPFAGSVQDRGRWFQEQMREFVLHYFMRVSDFKEPVVEANTTSSADRSPFLQPFTLCRPQRETTIGFGFSQLYYKTLEGRIGRFAPEERYAIVDLRDIGERFAWIVVKVEIFDFSFSYYPFGENGLRLTLPLSEESYLALSPDFITDRPATANGDRSHFGLGYAFIKNPEPGLLAYGPGSFEAAIEVIDFFVDADGRVRVGMIFVSNRPDRIANLSLDPTDWALRAAELASGGDLPAWLRPLQTASRFSPLRWLSVDPVYGGIDAANLMTGGLARRLLCASRRTLEEEFLIKHFEQHYQTVATSLHTWRQIPDWKATASLPDWVRLGR